VKKPVAPSLADRLRQWIADPMHFYRTEILLENDRPLGEQWDAWQKEDFAGIEAHPNSLIFS
jgi:hypothetical protein